MSYLGTTKIGKMYLGNTEIAKAYLGNTLVFQNGGSPTPPIPTNIAYIRGGADGSYIDTGITADETVRIIVWARNFNPGSVALFGSRVGGTDRTLILVAPPDANAGRIRYDFGSSQFFSQEAFPLLSHYHKYEVNGTQFLVDDTVVVSATAATFSNNLNIHLFGCNTNGTHTDMGFPADICACQIYKGGVLVRDFTPANSPSVGLYDAVSDTVFTNSGNGALSYGTFDSSAYTPLEYIECDKQQYFDSGVYGTEKIRIVSKFRMTSTEKEFSRLFGCRNSGDTIMCELMIGNTSYANRYYYMRYQGASNTVYSGASQTGNDLVFTATGNAFGLYKNNSSLGTKTGASGTFTTPQTMYVGTSNIEGDEQMQYAFYGRIYYHSLDAQHAYVPAKVNNVAGMYDTYNDVFKPSVSGTPFIAGPELN